MGHIILTSTGFYNPKILELVSHISEKTPDLSAAIITTAARGKELNKYAQITKDQLKNIGYKHIFFIDLENKQQQELLSRRFALVYVCGGNTFKLLKSAKESDFERFVRKTLDQGGVYVGVSAGSLLLGPSVQIAAEIDADINEVGLDDFTGLHVVPHIIFPHYNKEKHEDAVVKFEMRYGTPVIRLTNNEALVMNGEHFEIIN